MVIELQNKTITTISKHERRRLVFVLVTILLMKSPSLIFSNHGNFKLPYGLEYVTMSHGRLSPSIARIGLPPELRQFLVSKLEGCREA